MNDDKHSARSAKAVPTLEDVARHANVSTATVSRCLNSPDQVVERTRLRVLEAVRKLGYAPNFGARALAAKRTNTIRTLSLFRNYVQYHIACAKSYFHSRMRHRVRELLKVLERAKAVKKDSKKEKKTASGKTWKRR